jgi:hypothetical protein
MKTTIFAISLLFTTFAFQSCLFEEDMAFDKSASERLTNALKADNDSLQTASNGWAMEYFATETSPGYTMLVKFDNTGHAIFAGKSELTKNIYATDTCSYQMIGDAGPMLTFNTFSKILHAFSEPDISGLGLEGDFEFVVMKCTANQIILKGKKRGTTILLNKLTPDIVWPQYFTDLDAMNSILFGNNAPNLSLNIVNKYSFSNGANHIFNILKDSAGSNTSINAPFIVTRTGIRFYAVQVLDGKSFQTFTLNADKSALVSNENADVKLVGPENLAVYMIGNSNAWKIDPVLLSPKVKLVYDLVVQSCKTKFYSASPTLAVKDVILKLIYVPKDKVFALQLSVVRRSSSIDGEVYLTTTLLGNEITMQYNGKGTSIGLGFYDNNAGTTSNKIINGYKEMAAIVSSSFTLSTEAPLNPQSIKLVSKTDVDNWFTVTSSL